MTTPTPDETVTRLAEAIYPDHRGGTMAREVANMVIRVIQSDPSLAGFPAHVASEWDYGIPVTSPIILLPDPEPPAPTLPTKQDLLHLLNSYESDLQSDRSGLRYRQDILTMFSALYAAAEGDVSCG